MRRLSLALALLASSASAATVVRHSATGQCLTRDADDGYFLSTAACDSSAANQRFETRDDSAAQQTEIISHGGRGTTWYVSH